MCFSAESSLISATLLGGITIATLREAKKRNQLLLAIIPFVFMLMQFVEGIEWLAKGTVYEARALAFGAYFFFIISYVYWPTVASFILFPLAPSKAKKNTILGILFLSIAVVVANLILEFHAPSSPKGAFVERSIQYTYFLYQPYPWIVAIKGYVLLFLMFIPFLLSSLPLKWLNVGIIVASFAVASYAYVEAFVSVWCFFGTITSVSIYISLIFLNKNDEK